ncbi:MAG: Rpn family recombination-promoting nuclease/putative transposase [Ruminococcus flavefaciens]|nr:Rpn family recombination-promoting nuclease/putative transposase [Ruminococcus flavefaciens]MCM1363095.1 Rpn family recombination-promoting nuclease/putative transposase [Clostridiales bacterium]
MARDVVSAKLDIIFKKIFTENEDMLQSFLADILDIPYDDIQDIIVAKQELTPETVDGKFSRLDLNLKVADKLINVEIQLKGDNDYRDRTLFYWAKLYTSELKSGETYGQLKKTICINIINFNMFDRSDYHTEIVSSIKDTGEIFSDKFSIHFFELKKVGKEVNPNNRRELWMQFLNASSEEEFEVLKQTNVPIMNKAVNIIYDLSEDTKIREMARLREKALHDEASALANAKNEGKAEGRAEGISIGEENAVNKMIEKMRKRGMSEDEIKEFFAD